MTQPPQPDPTEQQGLDEHVDWMSYSHQQLYDMVNNGVDLTGATDVAGSWAKLSDTLLQMSSTLNTALAASADGWQGPAADQARGNLTGLVDWTNNTGENAVIVSGCVSRQSAALETARSSMPAPPPPVPSPIPVDQSHAFAQPPIAVPGPIASTRTTTEAHQQAARVMQQYQSSSADISRTIPQFALPTNPVNGPTPPPIANPIVPPGTAAHTGPAPIGGFGPAAPGGGLPAEESENGGMSGVGSPQSNPTARGSAGSGLANETEPARPAMSAGGLGGGGGRRDEDREHKRKYWKEDDGIFEVDTRVTPRVIGEEKRD
ncbi:MAG TPA: PPE domain-containing protein [Pseudonocardiaceae bacterium]|nr:PPE domain-containing protein [Pseudonocardiaceae bacterium]